MLRPLALAAGLACAAAAAAADGQRLDLGEALALKGRLEDDVLVLARILEAQDHLHRLNALRRARGLAALALPGELCAVSPLRPLCAALPATFARIEP